MIVKRGRDWGKNCSTYCDYYHVPEEIKQGKITEIFKSSTNPRSEWAKVNWGGNGKWARIGYIEHYSGSNNPEYKKNDGIYYDLYIVESQVIVEKIL